MTDFFMLIMAFRVSIFVFIVPMLMKEFGQKNKNKNLCCNDLSQWWVEFELTWLDCLLTDSEFFIWFAEISQILLKICFIPILLTFMYLVALYQKTKL